MIGPRHFSISEIVRKWSPRGSSTHSLINDKDGTSMSAGFVFFKDTDIPFTLWYDEVICCIATEERFSIVVGDQESVFEPGDMMWLPAKTSLTYRSRGMTTALWVVTPPDWEAHRPVS
ncbi:hypothetical protein [Dongia sp.]|uniref:hypothetical protein n=1 Tax=Dongia sp. TaxID=1977262 RepID=UPI003751C263